MSADFPLTVEVCDERLTISIGISTLAYAARQGPYFEALTLDPDTHQYDESRVRITDETVFAKEVARQLNQENEAGATLVHFLLDKAAEEVVEQGGEGISIPHLGT